MKKTKGHYPYRQAAWFSGMKIIGKAEDEELMKISSVMAEDIHDINPNISKEEIFKNLKKKKIFFCEQRQVFGGLQGVCGMGVIIVNVKLLDEINLSKEERLKSDTYLTLVHESIHAIQKNTRKKYNGHDLIGLIEGFTESETIKLKNRKRSSMSEYGQVNFQTTAGDYIPGISVARQLEAIYGDEITRNFAYHLDTTLLERMTYDMGRDFTYKLLEELKSAARRGKEIDIDNLQDEMMYKYFNNKIKFVSGKEQAEDLLNKYRKLGNKRIKTPSVMYQQYYYELLRTIDSKGIIIDQNYRNYIEPEFYVTTTLEEERDKVIDSFKFQVSKNNLANAIFDNSNMPKSYDELLRRFEDFYNKNKNIKQFEYNSDNFILHVYVYPNGEFYSYAKFDDKMISEYGNLNFDNRVLKNYIQNGIQLKITNLNENECTIIDERNNNSYALKNNPDFHIDKKDLYRELKNEIKQMSNKKLYNRKERKVSKKFSDLPEYNEYANVEVEDQGSGFSM